MPKKAKFKIMVRDKTQAKVRPPSDTASTSNQGDNKRSVIFDNKTADDVQVRLPGGVFTVNNVPMNSAFVVSIQSGASHEVDVQANAAVGIYSFKVFCEETFDFADGNSDPEFIIEN